MDLLDADIPLVLPKMSGVQSVNSKSINSAHSQKVLVSENDLPINRDDEDEVDKDGAEKPSNVSDKATPATAPDATTSTSPPKAAEEEKSANKTQISHHHPSQNQQQQQQQPQQQPHQPRHSNDGGGRLECIQEEKMDVKNAIPLDAIVLTAPKQNVKNVNIATETANKDKEQTLPQPSASKSEEKKEKSYTHQPLTEDLLLHHTQLEKLKVRIWFVDWVE